MQLKNYHKLKSKLSNPSASDNHFGLRAFIAFIVMLVSGIIFGIGGDANSDAVIEYQALVSANEEAEPLNTLLDEIGTEALNIDEDRQRLTAASLADTALDDYRSAIAEQGLSELHRDTELLIYEDPDAAVADQVNRWDAFTAHPDTPSEIPGDFYTKAEDVYLFGTFEPYSDTAQLTPVERNMLTWRNGFITLTLQLLLIMTSGFIWALLKDFGLEARSFAQNGRSQRKASKQEKKTRELLEGTEYAHLFAEVEEIEQAMSLHSNPSDDLKNRHKKLKADLHSAIEESIGGKIEASSESIAVFRTKTEVQNSFK